MKKYFGRTDILIHSLAQLMKMYLAFLIMMSFSRFAFLGYFSSPDDLGHLKADIIKAFFIGWKYDSIVASYLVIPFYLFVFPISLVKNVGLYNFFLRLMRGYFVLAMGLLLLLLVCDFGFYSFFQDHINILFFGLLEDDTEALLKSIQDNYPWQLICSVFILIISFVIYLSKKWFRGVRPRQRSRIQPGFFKFSFIYLLTGVLLLGGLRGGYGKMVLSPKYSDFSKVEFINHLAYNGVIALEEAIKLRYNTNVREFNMTKAMRYGDDIYAAFSDYLGIDVRPTHEDQLLNLIKRKTSINRTLESNKYHVIVLLMESFGNHWLNFNSQEFNILGDFSDYLVKGPYFKNIISSDNGTIGSLMSLATNIPPRPGKRFLSESKFMRLPLDSSAHLPYKKNGYETSFIYGGKLAWRNIGSYLKIQKYHQLIGESRIREDLNLPEHSGTEWGLYDKHLFDYIHRMLKDAKRPQFILGLSTSNHPPFDIGKNYQSKPLVLPVSLEKRILRERELFQYRFLAYQYANQMLANFLKQIEQSELRDKVIIAVTGDHNFWGFINYELSEAYSKYRVPLYFYLPQKLRKVDFNPDRVGSHEDIMITLYNLSLSDTEYFSFGEDLFSTAESFAINSGIYASGEGIVYKGKRYLWDQVPLIQIDAVSEKFERLDKRYRSTMAISDYYLERMLEISKMDESQSFY